MGGRAERTGTDRLGDSPPHPGPPHRKRGEGERPTPAAAAIAFCSLIALWHVSDAHAAGDKALGEYLSSECTTCHQTSGRQVGGIPAIIGYPADQFIALMEAYRDKQRDNQVMRTIAGRLTQDELLALATYYESLKPTK